MSACAAWKYRLDCYPIPARPCNKSLSSYHSLNTSLIPPLSLYNLFGGLLYNDMLAMCVRKAADPSGTTPTVQATTLTSSTGSATTAKGSSRRHKPLKAMRSRGTASTATGKQQETSDKRNSTANTVEVDCTVKVRDSQDGHLIYHKGDLVDQRCKLGVVTALRIYYSLLISCASLVEKSIHGPLGQSSLHCVNCCCCSYVRAQLLA